MNWTLEVVCLPVTDLDRSLAFYSEGLGFNVDIDTVRPDGKRMIQVTPPGSGCSVMLGADMNDMPPGSMRGLQLVVRDILAAHAELTERGVKVGEVQVFTQDGSMRAYQDGDWLDNTGFLFFDDPDGNSWAVQQISARD
uniref:Glyoxylase/dioxygenase superfamily n=1 Tax=Actinomadura madurae TaxID=1993 RepID=B0BLL4_9ACTN|nr:glyoxylase/dioxygenase superfamily [Actinomadura madurae]